MKNGFWSLKSQHRTKTLYWCSRVCKLMGLLIESVLVLLWWFASTPWSVWPEGSQRPGRLFEIKKKIKYIKLTWVVIAFVLSKKKVYSLIMEVIISIHQHIAVLFSKDSKNHFTTTCVNKKVDQGAVTRLLLSADH